MRKVKDKKHRTTPEIPLKQSTCPLSPPCVTEAAKMIPQALWYPNAGIQRWAVPFITSSLANLMPAGYGAGLGWGGGRHTLLNWCLCHTVWSIGRGMASGKCFQSPDTSLPSVEFPNLSLRVHPVRFQAHHPRVLRPYPESSHSRGLAMLWQHRSSSRIYTDNMYWVCRHNGKVHWGTKQTKTPFCWVSSS